MLRGPSSQLVSHTKRWEISRSSLLSALGTFFQPSLPRFHLRLLHPNFLKRPSQPHLCVIPDRALLLVPPLPHSPFRKPHQVRPNRQLLFKSTMTSQIMTTSKPSLTTPKSPQSPKRHPKERPHARGISLTRMKRRAVRWCERASRRKQ